MLHHVQLPQPRLVEWVTGRMNDMTQTILLRNDKHGIQNTLHSICRTNQCRPGHLS